MKCEDCRELLWAYLEGELHEEESAEIERHLAECADCRKELDVQQEIRKSLQCLPDKELPEGYHGELMQKLQREAAPNVVSFPMKKKAPKWKHLSMIAAAVLVVVAAGGINGMLEMRQNQNEAVQKMALTTDTATVYDEETAAEEPAEVERILEEQQNTADTVDNGKKMNTTSTAAGKEGGNTSNPADSKKEASVSNASETEAASAPAETAAAEDTAVMPFSMVRSAKVKAVDTAILLVSDENKALLEIQKIIDEVDGYEEVPEAEDDICAAIPAESYEAFVKKLELLGTLKWETQGEREAGEAYHSISIRLEQKS